MKTNNHKREEALDLINAPAAAGSQLPTGFPSPATDYLEPPIDLNSHIIEHPSATYFMRYRGEAMIGAHIPPNTILVVDRALKAKNGDVIVAIVAGELILRRLELKGTAIRLLPQNPKYNAIDLTEEMEAVVWGVVSAVVINKP